MNFLIAPNIRQISSPITDKMLAPLDERCRVVQFNSALIEDEYKILADFLGEYPDVTLRVYGNYDKSFDDLGFLKYFPFLKRFQAEIFDLKSFDALSYLQSDLRYLGLGQTRSKVLSLRILERFPNLGELYVEGHHRDIETISSLRELRKLTLRSITLPNLSVLKPLAQLWFLDIKLGGIKDFSLLPEIGQLKYIELWRILGLTNVQAISDVTSLQFLFLQALRRVEKLPSFKRLNKLRRLHLETMKGLGEISPIAEAPELKELVVVDMPQLQPEQFRFLVSHPSLEAATIGLGSKKRNEAVNRILSLPKASWGKDEEFEFQM